MKTLTDEILTLLSVHERAIGDLYAAFATALPAERRFWDSMTGEEMTHAAIINELINTSQPDSIQIDPKRLRPIAIQNSIDFVRGKTKEVKTNGITAVEALALARTLEHSLIEAQFFTIIQTNDSNLKRKIERLETQTIHHRTLIDRKLTDLKEEENQNAK